jgi:hypothetical protein
MNNIGLSLKSEIANIRLRMKSDIISGIALKFSSISYIRHPNLLLSVSMSISMPKSIFMLMQDEHKHDDKYEHNTDMNMNMKA